MKSSGGKILLTAVWIALVSSAWAKQPVDWVDPFIGTTNFGTTNPGAVCPNGMMSVVPFNVTGSPDNTYDKDARWWSAPYDRQNVFFSGFSHVNLSGVGCPELGSLLVMPTSGRLGVSLEQYGSRYSDEMASPGYYSNFLTDHGIRAEVTATPRAGAHRYTFPEGRANILINLGHGLTNESGAYVRFTGDGEVEGMKLMGTFCYNPQAVFPLYFVMRVSKIPSESGLWKKQPPMEGVKAQWDADHALSRLADDLGRKEDAALFRERSLGYRHYYSPEYGTFRPITPDGRFLTPFDPQQGMNFEENPGFHEGSAWNYTFYVPHDVRGLARLMGGRRKFVEKLEAVFAESYYDPANEPDIAYAHLFSYFRGEEWRTQYHTRRLLERHYTTAADGIPGNDDAGTMSAWAVFNMMGFYPDCPGEPYYTLTSPVFDKVTIRLDTRYWPTGELVIEARRNSPDDIYIKGITLGGRQFAGFRISHKELIEGGRLEMELSPNK